MIPKRFPRSFTANWLILILILAAMAGPSAILGAQASADFSATPLPGPIPPGTTASVSPGAAVAYDVFFDNTDTSNISQLFLNAVTPTGATLLSIESTNQPEGACSTAGNALSCSFGAMMPETTPIMMRVVYLTPASAGNFDVHFLFSTTGVSADKKKNSHGDDYDAFTPVTLNANGDFAGGYVVNAALQVADDQTLSKRNPQWTAVNPPAANIPVTVAERDGSLFACPGVSAASCFGQWSFVGVAGGATFTNGFSAQLGFNANKPNANFAHLFDAGVTDPLTGLPYELITEPCSSGSPAATELPCKIVTTEGGETFVTLWLKVNGNIKGY